MQPLALQQQNRTQQIQSNKRTIKLCSKGGIYG
jgi:hypothetical protein